MADRAAGPTDSPSTRKGGPASRVSGLFKGHPFRSGLSVGSVVTIIVVLLIVQNSDTVRLEWLFFDFEWPLWVVLLGTFVAGVVFSQLILVKYRRARRRARKNGNGAATESVGE